MASGKRQGVSGKGRGDKRCPILCALLFIFASEKGFCAMRSVRFATYSVPYITEDKGRDAMFNKYRRSLIALIAENRRFSPTGGWKVNFADSVCEGDTEALKAGEVDVLCTQRKETAPSWGYLSEEPLYMEYSVIVARETDKRFINGDINTYRLGNGNSTPSLNAPDLLSVIDIKSSMNKNASPSAAVTNGNASSWKRTLGPGQITVPISIGYCGEDGKGIVMRFSGLCRAAGGQAVAQEYRNGQELETALKEGTVDLCAMSVHDISDGFKVVYNMGASPIYFLCRDKEIKDDIDIAMKELKQKNPFYLIECMKRVGGGGSLGTANFNAGEVAFVKYTREVQPVYVTVHSKSAPFSDIDAVGNFTGLDLALWKKIENVSGMQFSYIDADKYTRRDGTDYLCITSANTWRVHGDYTLYTPAILTRHERVYARPGYDVSRFARSSTAIRGLPSSKEQERAGLLFARQDTAGDEERKRFLGQNATETAVIAMIREQRVILPFLNRWYKEYKVLLCDTLRECLEKTSDGVADMAIIDEAFMRSMHNIDEYPRLASRPPLLLDVPVSIQIKGPHSELINGILNKTLTQIPFEYFDREDVAAEIDMGYVPSRHKVLSRNVIGIIIFAFLLGSCLLIVCMVLSHRYKVRSETDEVTGFCNLAKFSSMAQKMLEDYRLQDNYKAVPAPGEADSGIAAQNASAAGKDAHNDDAQKAIPEVPAFVFVSISILGFRHLNNTMGYEWGRRLLRIVADCLRKVDCYPDMLVTHCYDDIFYCFVNTPDGFTRQRVDSLTLGISNDMANINETLVKAGFHVVVKSSVVYSSGYESIQSIIDKADYSRESVSSEQPQYGSAATEMQGAYTKAISNTAVSSHKKRTENVISSIRQAMTGGGSRVGEGVSRGRLLSPTPFMQNERIKCDGNFAVFDNLLAERRESESNIERHIGAAFDDNELMAVYQPKIDLQTGRLEGAEAFARWNSPSLGVMLPNVFLPVFEKNGYALRFNFSMFMNVLSFLQTLIDRGDTPVPISMNVTQINITSSAFVRRFENMFGRFSVPRQYIEFELSEKSLGLPRAELQRLSAMLHEGGFSVAIDDFGTGGSSLSILSSVPSDIVKFDQRVFSDPDTSNGSKIILTQLIQMSHLLGRKVVCKCVEKKSQVELLRSIGCDMVQGYYYSNALTSDEFRNYIDTSI